MKRLLLITASLFLVVGCAIENEAKVKEPNNKVNTELIKKVKPNLINETTKEAVTKKKEANLPRLQL